jgi:hypothetical protein
LGGVADFRELCMKRAKRVAVPRNLHEIHLVLML